MNDDGNGFAGRVIRFANRHRRKLWAAGAVIVAYTLLGFFLVPWLVQKIVVDTVHDRYDAELTIGKISFNPYVLSLRLDGLSFRDPDDALFFSADQIYVNLQTSSIFRLAPTFAEIRLDAPVAHLARDAAGALNAGFLATGGPVEEASEATPESDDTGPPRLIVHQFVINAAALHWDDAVPPQPVDTTFGPVNVSIRNLNTLPQREGQQEVVITTESAGTLSWSGSLQLNPLRSAGRAAVRGSHMPLTSAYIRDALGFEIVRGHADVGFDYLVDTAGDGSIEASVDNFNFALGDVLIRTFGAATSAGEPNDRDVLVVNALSIGGGTFRWPERTISIEKFAIDDSTVSIHRDAAGVLNVEPRRNPAEAMPPEPEPQKETAGDPWSFVLRRFEINGMSVGVVDESVEPHADMGIDDLTLAIGDISTAIEARFPLQASIRTRAGGTIRADGEIGLLPDPIVELEIAAEGLSLAESHPYIQPLADVNLDSGSLAFDASVVSSPDDALAVTADIGITDFLITETDEGSRLGSWDRLALEQFVLSLADRSLAISEIRLEQPYADIFVAEDGSVNLGRIRTGEPAPADPGDDATEAAEPAERAEEEDQAFDVTIGRVLVADAAADFADFSLPLPFEAGIAELNGTLTTIATSSSEPSAVSLEGKVDEFGLVRVTGTLTPLDVKQNTDLQVRFQNVEIPKFSAYTVAFAGRQIASGKLDLDLGYKVSASELEGENRVVLRDFTLGEEVEHPGAMSLPLGLAVALLKGPDGTIDIDLPVRGNVDDPEFGYGRVIGKALVNLVVKVVASPFALLGKLVGIEADELDHVSFVTGRSDLTPPELERIGKLAEALSLRPELELEIGGVVDRESDGLALRTAKFDDIVESRIAEREDADEPDAMYAEQRAEIIEALYRESGAAEGDTLDLLRTRFTTESIDDETGRPVQSFDALAFTAELRRLLIDEQVITEQELVALATARAENVRVSLISVDGSLASRIRSGELRAVGADKDGSVRMDVTLKAAKE
jgi:uncharacterized protein involved in outer membrane biogenesis